MSSLRGQFSFRLSGGLACQSLWQLDVIDCRFLAAQLFSELKIKTRWYKCQSFKVFSVKAMLPVSWITCTLPQKILIFKNQNVQKNALHIRLISLDKNCTYQNIFILYLMNIPCCFPNSMKLYCREMEALRAISKQLCRVEER